MTSTTLTSAGLKPRFAEDALHPALAIIWHPAAAARVGEVAVLPAGSIAPSFILGRYKKGYHYETLPLLGFGPQRPGTTATSRPLQHLSHQISKCQVRLQSQGPRAISLLVEGKAPVLVNGHAPAGLLRPGDTLALGKELLLLCVLRPATLPGGVGHLHSFGGPDEYGIVGESPCVWRLRADIAHRASLDHHVLVLGPTGTGKELVARALHGLSSRRGGPFVAVNSAGIPDNVLESQLFGYVRGAFTGAVKDSVGLIQSANEGSVFLDEIAEMPGASQAKLLRFLENGEVQRIGEVAPRRVDVRTIAATWQDTEQLRSDIVGRFRLTVKVPTIDERREDIPLLIVDFLRRELAHPLPTTIELMDGLVRQQFPHGIRELQRLVLLALTPAARSQGVLGMTPELRQVLELSPPSRPGENLGRDELCTALEQRDWDLEKVAKDLSISSRELSRLRSLHGLEKRVDEEITEGLVRRLLAECNDDKKRVQRMLGITRHQLRHWLAKL